MDTSAKIKMLEDTLLDAGMSGEVRERTKAAIAAYWSDSCPECAKHTYGMCYTCQNIDRASQE